MTLITCRIKGYIQPFERRLALEELKVLALDEPRPVGGDMTTATNFEVTTKTDKEKLRVQLAYWEAVGTDQAELTAQVRGEATSLVARNGVILEDLPLVLPGGINSKTPNKRCLRYATHGLHEYRGKFFPQLVRSLINLADVPSNGIVLDPMCGSGTTLVEAALAGRRAVGLDMNPLSVFATGVKCSALHITPAALIEAHQKLMDALLSGTEPSQEASHFAKLSDTDRTYLARWFAPQTIMELDRIQWCMSQIERKDIRDLYRLSLSNILRGVSWQKPEDLRVRKQVVQLEPGEVVDRFIVEATRAAKFVVAFALQRERLPLGSHVVMESDARMAADVLSDLVGKVDCIITSPPYATALPYLDTDRLSLIYLELLPRTSHRARDTEMIGNREVTNRTRDSYWARFQRERERLPSNTRSLIEKIDTLNSHAGVGFRRRNLSALLAKYFLDMRDALGQQHRLLRKNGVLYMVVGNNRTTAGGELIDIRTTDHLAEIAQDLGFKLSGTLPMEMLVSRDIFSKNAMPSEQIITLQKV